MPVLQCFIITASATRNPGDGDTERTPQKSAHSVAKECKKRGGVQKQSVKSGIVIVSREEHRNRSHVPACLSAKGTRAGSLVTALFSVFSNPDSLLHEKSA